MTKKLMALLLAVLMAVSLLPMPALADGSATVITDISKITEAGSYILDKAGAPKEIVLSGPLAIGADVTLELTGQTVTLALAEGESYADSSVFHVESGSLTLKGAGTVKVPDNASGIVVAKLTTVAPIINFGMPEASAIQLAASTKRSPPFIMQTRPTANRTRTSISVLPVKSIPIMILPLSS